MKLMVWKHQTQRVFVYRNLHQKCWSVRSLSGNNKGRVILHASSVDMHDAVFRVSESGRQRVITEQQKNVHAGVVGYLSSAHVITERHATNPVTCQDTDCNGWGDRNSGIDREVTYNPYKFSSFVYSDTLSPVTVCNDVTLDDNMKVKILNRTTVIAA